MSDLKAHIASVADFPRRGILFRDITPLLRTRFAAMIDALEALLDDAQWATVDAVAGIESRGFILAGALAERRGKGFVPIRKQGKLPPPVVDMAYSLEYGTGVLEMQPGAGQLLLVDDVLATGGTMSAAAQLCGVAGYSVGYLAVLIDLQLVKNFRCGDLPLRSVVQYE